jgi:NitT/TauT family transport system ATP-binding protein
MTPEGRTFLAADINTRKKQLNAMLRLLYVFDLVVQALKLSERGEVDEAVVLNQLAQAFPHEQPQRILKTIVSWARYAELFKYSSIRRVFHGQRKPAST